MSNAVRTRLIQIGNSRGIRIPKLLLDQAGLTVEVELKAQPDRLVVRSSRPPRHGWDERFKAMAEAGDDKLLDQPLPSTMWDEQEWEW